MHQATFVPHTPQGFVQLPVNAQGRVPTRVLARFYLWPDDAPSVPLAFSSNVRYVTVDVRTLTGGQWIITVQLTAAPNSGLTPTMVKQLFTVNVDCCEDKCGSCNSSPCCCERQCLGWPYPQAFCGPPWHRNFLGADGIIKGQQWSWAFGYVGNDVLSARMELINCETNAIIQTYSTTSGQVVYDQTKQLMTVTLTPSDTLALPSVTRVRYRFIVTGSQGDNLPYYEGLIDII